MNSCSKQPSSPAFDRNALAIDAEKEVTRIVEFLRESVHRRLHRQGAVVGISGGVDSSVVLGLCVRAFGPERVVALVLPERDSSPESLLLACRVAEHNSVHPLVEDITPILEAFGCYRRRDEAIARVFPDFAPGWKSKITIPGDLLEQDSLSVFRLTVVDPEGREFSRRLAPADFYQIVAASNFKQRARMAMLYYHAELRNYAMIGTANKNEHALGFFVKHGDGGADVQPIAHLLKTQVYQLAEQLGVPEEIRRRTPTTDTYSAGSSQKDFFFRVAFEILDLVWLGHERGIPANEIGEALGLTTDQIERVVADIQRKARTTEYLRMNPVTLVTFRA